MQTVARLSALTRLCLTTWPEPLSAVPRCSELACLHSSSLQDLSISQNLVRWAGIWINEFKAPPSLAVISLPAISSLRLACDHIGCQHA